MLAGLEVEIIGEQSKENKMTNEELYDLMKEGFAQVNQRLDTMDERLRTVESAISELKGKQSAIAGVQSWIVAACAIGALVISIVVAIVK